MTRDHVLVTGGAGFIGSHLVDRLLLEGYRVTVFDNLSRGNKRNINSRADWGAIDLRVPFKKIFPKIDRIYHLAAVVPDLQEMTTRQLSVAPNLAIDWNVVSYAAEYRVPLTYVSSAMVYRPSDEPIREDSLIMPQTLYGWSKFMGEALAGHLYLEEHVPVTIVRLFNVYGPRDCASEGRRHVIAAFLRAVREDAPLVVWGDGQARRSFLHVSDAVDGILTATRHFPNADPVNVGSEREMSILSLARRFDTIQTSGATRIVHDYTCPVGVARMTPSTKKLRATGWGETVSLEDGISALVASGSAGPSV